MTEGVIDVVRMQKLWKIVPHPSLPVYAKYNRIDVSLTIGGS
jgi:hypothetical protein